MQGAKLKRSSQSAPDGHATGLLGLPAVLERLSDPSHRCQGPELTCLLQALCKQLISAASNTNSVIFTSAERSRATAAQAAAADVFADLAIGAPERCIPSPQPFSSEFSLSYHARTHTDVEVPASSQSLPAAAASTNTTPLALGPIQHPQNRAAAAAARAEAARRPPAGPTKINPSFTATTTAAPPPAPHGPTSSGAAANATAAAAAIAGLFPATRDPTEGLAGMVTTGIALLVDHLEHFHYRAKAVSLDGLLSLSAVGLGPDRRLDPAGIATLPLSASGAASTTPACATAAAENDANAVGEDPAAVGDAVQALGGMGLGDWLALRIVTAGAIPRLLEMLTQRTGMSFVAVRQLASQVVHNLARRRNAAVRTALARWRPLPGLVSGLDVVLEDSPEIAARLLLVMADLFPITAHQIAGALHKLVAKQQQQQDQAAAATTQAQGQPQQPQQDQAPPPAAAAGDQRQRDVGPGDEEEQRQQLKKKASGDVAAGDVLKGATAAAQKARAGPVPELQPVLAKGRRGGRVAEVAAGRGAAGAGAATAPAAAAGRSRRGAAAAVHPAPVAAARPGPPAGPDAAQVAPAPGPLVSVLGARPGSVVAATVEPTTMTHLGLAPDVDVPLEALLMRVTGYYMRLAYNAVLAPAPLPQLAGVKPPYGEAERRECERALISQRAEENRRRRKEAAQLDCCVAALLAAAPMPSCLFEAMSYSHTRAFAVLAGPPPQSTTLMTAPNGGLWRAQDLLPYALNLIQSLGGGSDSGDGGINAAAVRSHGAVASSPITGAAPGHLLLVLPSAAFAAGGGAIESLNSSCTAAVSAALDRFWGLDQPRCVVQGPAAGAFSECPGPALPSAPHGDKPVTSGLMEHCGPVIRGILERAIQASDALPAPTAAGGGAASASAAAAPAPAAAEVLVARVEAMPLAVLRAAGATFLSISRSHVAQRVVSFTDCLESLTASLSRRTDSAAAGVAQARMALGLASLWACAAGGRRDLRRHESRAPPASAGAVESRPAAADAAEPAAPQAEDVAVDEKPPEPQLRRSARIKRRRDGGAAAVAAPAPASDPSGSFDLQIVARAAAPAAAVAQVPDATQKGDSLLGDASGSDPGQAKLLDRLVDMLEVRFADARQLQDAVDAQLRQQQAQQQQQRSEDADSQPSSSAGQGAGSALSIPLTAAAAAAASGAAGAWLAAVAAAAASATATAAVDRARLVLETQAVLLQALALLVPALDAAQAGRLAEAGAVHAAVRMLRAAAISAPSPSPTAATPSTEAAEADAPASGNGNASSDAVVKEGQLQGLWNEEPHLGITATQALGLLLQLLRLSGAASYVCGGVQQPEALAALGGALLVRRRPAERPQLPVLQLAVAGAHGQEVDRILNGSDGDPEDSLSRTWEVLGSLSSGEQPCAGHDVVLQLLGPLAALTHGSSARCGAARAALMGVLMQVLRWSHSKAQRRRLLCQVLALWAPHLQCLLLRLPHSASPVSMPRAAAQAPVAAAAPVTATDGPLGLTTAVETKAACNLGRTNSQSTMPYTGIRSGRLSTPMNSVNAASHNAIGTSSGAVTQPPGQRTPPWGSSAAVAAAVAAVGSGCAAGAAVHAPGAAAALAAAAHVIISPTQHSATASGLRTAVPPNPVRGRKGSRLASGLASPVPAPRGVCLQCGGDAVFSAAAAGMGMGTAALHSLSAGPAVDADASIRDTGTVKSVCELLEGAMEQLADCEVVRHMHATGWLRTLLHGVRCTDTSVRESCHRVLTAAARTLGSGSRSFPPGMLTNLEADNELRNQLCALDPGVSALFVRRQEALMMLPPRGPENVPLRSSLTSSAADTVVVSVWGRRGRGEGLQVAAAAGGALRLSDGGDGAPLARRRSTAPPAAVQVAYDGGNEADARTLPNEGAKSGELGGLQLPENLALVLPPLAELQPARRGRRRGATAAAARGPSRVRKGGRPAAPAAKAAAPAEDAVLISEVAEIASKASPASKVAAAAAPASRRIRARKGAATRRVRSAVARGEAEAAPEGPSSGEELVGGGATAAPALVAPGPWPLASPLPKRRRVSELNGEERQSAAAVAAGALLPGRILPSEDGKMRPPLPRPALLLSVPGASPEVAQASGAAPELPSAAAGRSETGTVASSTKAIEAVAEGAARSAAPSACGGSGSARSTLLDLQLTARELCLAEAVRCACQSLESALAARRHDLAAVCAADQAAAAAAAAAASMAIAAAAAPAPEAAAPAQAPEDAVAAHAARKKTGRIRIGLMTAPSRGTAGGKQAAAAVVAPPPPPVQPPAAAAAPAKPVAVADDEFLSRTYRGVSKRLNFDDM